jgi:hypothetical protein
MYEQLKEVKDNDRVGDFLFPSLPNKVKGKIISLAEDMVVVESNIDGDNFQFITHPNNICIVQKKTN